MSETPKKDPGLAKIDDIEIEPLSDDDLDSVAGGATYTCPSNTCPSHTCTPGCPETYTCGCGDDDDAEVTPIGRVGNRL